MRLIDADALKINLETFATVHGMSDFYSRHEVLDSIRRAPTLGDDRFKIKTRPTPDDPLMSVLICAVRYCLGRRTYMPDVVTRWIMASVPLLPAETAKILLRDINDQRRLGERIGKEALGDPCDVQTWERFESWLQGRLCDGV